MKNLGYYNGKYDELENMSIPMNDRSHWFGDGVYDAGPARNYPAHPSTLISITCPSTLGQLLEHTTEA